MYATAYARSRLPPLPPTRPQEACDEAIACFKKLLSELEEPQHGEVMRGNGLKVEQLRVRGLACLRGAARAAHLDDRIRTLPSQGHSPRTRHSWARELGCPTDPAWRACRTRRRSWSLRWRRITEPAAGLIDLHKTMLNLAYLLLSLGVCHSCIFCPRARPR